jgi:hypothetical protein
MAWLGTWANRIEITLESTVVDATLTDFPVLVYLSTSSGINDQDVSSVFDELTSDANRLKIAITKSDGVTEQYVEIEKWDDASEEAWLWTKVPLLSSSSDTNIYLYYDSSASDNTTYVGDIGSTPGQAVWDANFKGVFHMVDATTSTIKDSTANGDLVKQSANNPLEDTSPAVTGNNPNQLISSDFADDVTDVAARRWGTADYTYEGWIYPTSNTAQDHVLWQGNDVYDHYLRFMVHDTYRLHAGASSPSGGTSWNAQTAQNTLAVNTWAHVAMVRDAGTTHYLYKNGVSQTKTSESNPTETSDMGGGVSSGKYSFANGLSVGSFGDGGGGNFDGNIDEVRISSTKRSTAWLNTTYETTRDALISNFAAEETTGWSVGSVNTVASASIASISTVAIGDIASVNGVT